jgi:hypothetical protein
MRSRAALLTMLLAAGAAGCSVLISLDGTTGGTAQDAATEAADAGGVGTVDAADALQAHDVMQPAADAADTGLYPPGSWCSMQPMAGLTFCDDFDPPETTAFERWSEVRFDVAGTGRLSNVAVSKPKALDIVVPPYTSSTFFIEALVEHVRASPTSSSLEFSFDIQPPTPTGDAGLGDVYVASIVQGAQAGPRVAVSFRVGPGGALLQEQVTSATGHNDWNTGDAGATMPPMGSWSHIVITVDFAAKTATLAVGSTMIPTVQLKGAWMAQSDSDVYLGNWYIPSEPGYEARYDNAVIRQP